MLIGAGWWNWDSDDSVCSWTQQSCQRHQRDWWEQEDDDEEWCELLQKQSGHVGGREELEVGNIIVIVWNNFLTANIFAANIYRMLGMILVIIIGLALMFLILIILVTIFSSYWPRVFVMVTNKIIPPLCFTSNLINSPLMSRACILQSILSAKDNIIRENSDPHSIEKSNKALSKLTALYLGLEKYLVNQNILKQIWLVMTRIVTESLLIIQTNLTPSHSTLMGLFSMLSSR